MRILIPLLLLFSSIAADAQLRFTLDPSFRREVGFLIAKKGFAGPRTCGLPTSPNSLDAPPKGFQVYDTCANKLYAWSGSGWLQIGGSGTVTLDTTTIYLNIGSKLNKTDTAFMLLPYARQSNVTAALAAKLSISDTLSMLNAYAKQAETNAALAGKVNIADTQLMLLGYVRQGTIHIFSILGIDSVGKQVGDFVRYDSLGNLSLQGFPATFELDDATNGLVVANYSGVTVVPGTLLWKAKADELYASVGSLSAKLNASDTQTMLQNYRHWLAGYLSSVNIANINATGTPSATTYLRGDGTWATPDAGGGGGTPGGSSGQVQYNDAGTFAGAANVDIEGGQLRLDNVTTPTAPASGGIKIYSKNIAGNSIPYVKTPDGVETAVQPSLFMGKMPVWVGFASGTTAPVTMGGTIATAATMGTANPASTNEWTKYQRKTYTTSTTAGNQSGLRQSYTQFSSATGGFFAHFKFGQTIALNGEQKFIGMCASTAALGGDASALTNIIGMGIDAADVNGNWYLMYNDGTGTATRVDLGANAVRNTTDGYELNIYVGPGSSTYYVYIKNLATGADVYNGSLTTDVPASSTLLAWKAECRNGAVAAATNLHMAATYIQPL